MTHATKRFVAAAGLASGIRLHDIRHGVATAMLARGVDTKNRVGGTGPLVCGIHG